MKVLLLANQPERTTRLKLFEGTLRGLGHEVIVPSFGTLNWISIARKARRLIEEKRPDAVHVFNVPDVIYHGLPKMRGRHFQSLIYDYRSPWGVESQMRFGGPGRAICEVFERELAKGSDLMTTVNAPLREKALDYAPGKEIHVIPNYPSRSFANLGEGRQEKPGEGEKRDDVEGEGNNRGDGRDTKGAVIFVGRVCEQEGIDRLLEIADQLKGQEFWIVGGGPFAWWYLRKRRENVKALGWQPHGEVAALVKRARICIIPREENALTPYSTDKSVWKLNEYLNLGKQVVASGVTPEGTRKNLLVVPSSGIMEGLQRELEREPRAMGAEDFRYWESNAEEIRRVYDGLE